MAVLALVHVAQERPASAERRVVFGRSSVPRGLPSRRIGSRQGFVRLEDLKDIPGFSNLKQLGNNLVEFTADGFGNARVSPLFIGQRGELIGATRANTIRQAKEFFLNNLDNFQGNQLNAVRRFLVANGAGSGALFGNLVVDLANSVVPSTAETDDQGRIKAINPKEYVKKNGENRVKLAALNFLLNTISQSASILRVNPQNVGANGLVGMNLNNFMRAEALALLTNNNPYDCTGTGRAPFRLDLLIARAMDADIYYQLIGAPRKFQDLANQLGIETQRRRTFGNKIVVSGTDPNDPTKRESIVGKHPQRMIEIQNTRNILGGSMYISYDNKFNQAPGVRTESTDAFINGVDTTFEAGEMIFTKPNGFLGFYLADAAGNRANSAPNEIAQAQLRGGLSRRDGDANDVTNPVNCLVCHGGGFIAGGKSLATNRPYTDNFNRIPPNHRQFFTTNPVYAARARRDSIIFRNAMIRAGAFIPDASSNAAGAAAGEGEQKPATLLPDFVGEYGAPLTMERAAKELGTTPDRLQGLLRTNDKGTIARKDFETRFCQLKAAVGAGGTGLASDLTNSTGRGILGFSARSGSHSSSFSSAAGSARPVAQ